MKQNKDAEILAEKVAQVFFSQVFSGNDKFRHVKYAILEALKNVAPGSRFPAIRMLSSKLKMGTIPIQKAVMELVGENRLYSRGRVGLFVKTPPDAIRQVSINRMAGIKIFDNENSELLRQLAQKSVSMFCENYTDFDTKLAFEPFDSPDLFIQSNCEKPLNLQRTLGGLHPRQPYVFCGEYTMPLAYQVLYFAWNRELLAKHGIPEPDYTDFTSQEQYFKELNRNIDLPVLSIISPDCLCNSSLFSFFSAYDAGNEKEAWSLFETIFTRAENFFNGFRFAVFQKEHEMFFQQQRPGLLLMTNQLNSIRKNIRNFTVGIRPLYDLNNQYVFLPLTIQAADHLESFFQICKMVEFLQGDQVQELFAQHDFGTVRNQIPCAPQSNVKNFSISYTENVFHSYVQNMVIRSEMLNTAIYQNDRKRAMQNIRDLTQTIFQYFRRK